MMTEHKRLWMDPPQGYLYGFPKVYEPMKDGNLNAWLLLNGYPKCDPTMAVRFWPAEEE